jgi:hypothetical protein
MVIIIKSIIDSAVCVRENFPTNKLSQNIFSGGRERYLFIFISITNAYQHSAHQAKFAQIYFTNNLNADNLIIIFVG